MAKKKAKKVTKKVTKKKAAKKKSVTRTPKKSVKTIKGATPTAAVSTDLTPNGFQAVQLESEVLPEAEEALDVAALEDDNGADEGYF